MGLYLRSGTNLDTLLNLYERSYEAVFAQLTFIDVRRFDNANSLSAIDITHLRFEQHGCVL